MLDETAQLDLKEIADGVLLPVKAFPSAKSNGIGGVHNGRLKVHVTAAPEKGKANKAIIRVLADALCTNRSSVQLRIGETNQQKSFLISNHFSK